MFGAERKQSIWRLIRPSTILYFVMSFAEPLWAGPAHETEIQDRYRTSLVDGERSRYGARDIELGSAYAANGHSNGTGVRREPAVLPPSEPIEISPAPTVSPDVDNSIPKGRGKLIVSVRKLTGDFAVGHKGPKGAARVDSGSVYVFKGKISANGNPFQELAGKKPFTTLRPDARGRVEAELPVGVYTVLIEVDGKYYLNSFEADDNYTSVEIKDQRVTYDPIVDSSRSTF